jgi:phosphonate transport system permease protein
MSPAPPPIRPLPEMRWYERLNVLNITLLIFLMAVLFSTPVMQGSGRELNYLKNFLNFSGNYFPPDFSVSGRILWALWETFQIAVMATFFSVFLSIPLAAAGARTLSPRWLVVLARMIMNMIRTVPSLIWALVAVAVVGPNPLAGVIALTFYSLGYLGKFFSDAFESVDVNVAKGLKAIGAGNIQAFQHGLWPHAKPLVWSYALWMLEYNIRSASIIGFVGAGGVGLLLFEWHQFYQDLPKFTTVLLFILVLVTLLDLLGEIVRKKITQQVSAAPMDTPREIAPATPPPAPGKEPAVAAAGEGGSEQRRVDLVSR